MKLIIRKIISLLIPIFLMMSPHVYAEQRKPALPLPIADAEDVSDRKYFPAIRELISDSKVSIDIALKEIAATALQRDPVNLLLEDLISAHKRGVRIRLFLNTSTERSLSEVLFLRDDKLAYLNRVGIETHFVSPSYIFSDQVLIFDRQMLVEGGPAWTLNELEKGYGSASLIRSPRLAETKIVRLELLPLWNIYAAKDQRQSGVLPVPLFLLQDLKYFPQMVSNEEADAMKIYLALLGEYFKTHSDLIKMNLEELAQRMPSERLLGRGTAEGEVIGILRRLSEEYELLTIQKQEPETVHVKLKLPLTLQTYIEVPQTFFEEQYVKQLSARAIYVYFLIRYHSQISGQSPVWIGSLSNVQQDFPVKKPDFTQGVDELRRENLIEIFPFSLKQGDLASGPGDVEYRYLVNEIPTLAQRLASWSRLREQLGDERFIRAQELAEILGEPKDDKVIVTYANLLEQYPEQQIRSFTEHLKTLAPQGTPDMLSYLQIMLKNETQGVHGLGA